MGMLAIDINSAIECRFWVIPCNFQFFSDKIGIIIPVRNFISYFIVFFGVFYIKNRHELPHVMNISAEKEIIGSIIQSRRKTRKIAQEQLADIAGISPRTLRGIEKGIANPELETLMKICDVLGMEIKIEVIK